MKTRYFKQIILSTLLCASIVHTGVAQENKHCGTTEATKVLELAHPELIQQEIDYNNAITKAIADKKNRSEKVVEQVYTIPVVFHIIHTYGTENISDAQIMDEMTILNNDYRKLNADISAIIPAFQGLAADVKVQFKLAQLDPNGNCTNGIDRIYSHKTNNADDNSKLNQWPRNKYLNVWTVKTIGSVGVAGYAYYPSAVTGPAFPIDGILILSSYIGSIGTSSPMTSRALTHEIGHWMNLEHPWGNTNAPGVACGDDLVNDTPITKGHLNCSNLYDYTCDNAAIAAAYNFSGVTLSSGMSDPTTPPIPLDSGLLYTHFSAVGVSANPSSAGMFNYSSWGTGAMDGETVYSALAGAIDTAKYYEFTVTPVLGQVMSLTGLSFDFQRNATGVRTYSVRSSIDGFTSNLAAAISPVNANLSVQTGNVFFINGDSTSMQAGSRITLGGASFTTMTSPVTFRIYGFNAEDSTGSFGVDNLAVSGTYGTIENVENYMDYSYCSKMFTLGQKDRMRAALESTVAGRNNLWTPENLALTGTDGSGVACAPTPDFYANHTEICAGATVNFTPNITNGTATLLSWTFGGGAPNAFGLNPAVIFNTPGIYDVTLTAANSIGGNTTTKTTYIRVNPNSSDFTGPYSESFETTDHYFYFWQPNNLDAGTNTFGLSTTTGYNSSHSVIMTGFGNAPNDVDELVSPAYNLTGMTGLSFSFRCAAASRGTLSSDVTDVLKIYASTDCGATWGTPKETLSSTTAAHLINNGYHPESYVPAGPSDWALISFLLPGSVASADTRFKFEYTTGKASNNIYIDDVNISGALGIDENTIDNGSVSLYPNPANQSTTVSYHLNKKATTKIELIDLLGKKIMEVNNNSQGEGDYNFTISKQELNLNNGIYFVRLSIDSNTITKKLIITE